MKVEGLGKIEIDLEGKYRQPYPAVDSKITVDEIVADLVISTGQIVLTVDGQKYGGELLYILRKMED
jgi:hypothetical protein